MARRNTRLVSKAGTVRPFDALPHGKANTYNWWGCRCAACTAAMTGSRGTTRRRRTVTPWSDGTWCYNAFGGRRKADMLPHGDNSTYTNWGCRCDACRAAWTAVCMRRRVERSLRLRPDDPRHGNYTTYTNYGCRCALCVEANRQYSQKRSLRRREAS